MANGVSMAEQYQRSSALSAQNLRIACKDCNLFQLCLPMGIDSRDLEELDRIIKRRRPLKRGEQLFGVGDSFSSIYAVRSGSIKTYIPAEDGQEQVTGFHLPGELLGLDAIHNNSHPCAARALETTSLCEIPFERLGELSQKIPSLQSQLLKIMSKEILHDQSLLLLLGKKSAEERLAALLLSLSGRYCQRGFSASEFNLSMSRNDIGNYLGLAVETVSRLFTKFQERDILAVQRKHVRIIDAEGLTRLAAGTRHDGGKQQAG